MKMRRRVLCIVLILCILFPAAAWAVNRLPHAILTPEPAAAAVGGEFTVEMSCRSMEVGSYTAGFSFDTELLEVVSVTCGDAPVFEGATVSGVSAAEDANAAGTVGCYAVHAGEAKYAQGSLMLVTFRAKAPGTAVLTPYEDCDGTESFAGITGKTEVRITASGETCGTLQWWLATDGCTVTVQKGGETVWSGVDDAAGSYSLPAEPGDYVLTAEKDGELTRVYYAAVTAGMRADFGTVGTSPQGDVNGDCRTDITDMQCLFTYLSTGIRPEATDETAFAVLADHNGDGTTNILDYQSLYAALRE